MAHAVCICNPYARMARTHFDKVKSRLHRHGYKVEFQWTAYRQHAMELAQKAAAAKTDLVIAAGGDGTINEIACGLALSTVPLAVLPCGTGNVLAKEIHLPDRLLQAVDAIPRSKPMRIALGKGGGRYFVLMAGVGVDAEIICDLHAAVQRMFGVAGFWLEALRYWAGHHPPSFSVSMDGEQHDCTFAIVGRSSWYAGGVKITPRANLNANTFDVCLFEGGSRFDYLRYLSGVIAGTHLHFHDVKYLSGMRVEITSRVPIHVQMDGEIAGLLPMTFEIVPDALTLLVPPDPDAG
jgi:diacylglycerol kinase (ATP)